MTAVEKFKTDLANWFNKNGFEDVGLCFGEDFAYVILDNGNFGVQVGVQAYPEVGRYFEQFLYEYGLDYVGIFDPVLSLIHELGHNKTINCFDEVELALCDFAKHICCESEDEHDWYNSYWEVPDEFAANMWAIKFINEHVEAVKELCDIYANDWSAIFEETTMEELLNEVA